MIYLPPFFHMGSGSGSGPVLPAFLEPYPTAVINYRWPESSPDQNASAAPRQAYGGPKAASPLHWPTPLHDTLFGYSWIADNLSPPGSGRRDIYVYGSYLGASLAASLALTECYPHQRLAIRGLVAYNGIYNWTMFLPDHPIHKSKGLEPLSREALETPGSMFHYLKQQMPALFRSPANLFDPFASSSLLFHNPGLLIPDDFYPSSLPSSFQRAVDELSLHPLDPDNADSTTPPPSPPRKGYLAFPPRQSTLRIPETLLLHESPPPLPRITARRRIRTAKKGPISGEHNFKMQAMELAGLMRRSVEKLELKERAKWDPDFEDWDDEVHGRVQVTDVGSADAEAELGTRGQGLVAEWLEGRAGTRGGQTGA